MLAAGILAIGVAGCGSATHTSGLVGIPNVIGSSAVQATARLRHAGLQVVSSVRWSGADVGSVLAQTPAGGSAPPHQSVAIVVAAAGARVPAVVGEEARAAVSTLRRSGFRVPRAAPAGGVVVSQEPASGWARPHSPVRLRIVTGETALLHRIENAFATWAMTGVRLDDVSCRPAAAHARAFTCTGYSRALDYRTNAVVTFQGGKLAPLQPPAPPRKTKKQHAHHHHHSHATGHGQSHHAHAHAHAHGHAGHAHTSAAATTTRRTTHP